MYLNSKAGGIVEKIIEKIQIPEGISYYAQQVKYELDGLKILVDSAVTNSDFEYKPEQVDMLIDKYIEKYKEYQVLYEEIKKEFMQKYIDNKNIKYRINIIDDTMEVYEGYGEESKWKDTRFL
jgi:hypothetical protein